MGLSDKNYIALFQVSERSAGWHSRNLILAIYCRIATFTV